MRITGLDNAYKTMVKMTFAEGQNCGAQSLIKPVIYGAFPRHLAEKGPKSL